MGLFDDLLAPLKDIGELVADVRQDLTGSAHQVMNDITSLKDEGQAAISDLTNTVKDSIKDGQDIIGK